MAIEEQRSGRFLVRLVVDGRRQSIGTYDTFEEAEEAEAAHHKGSLRSEIDPLSDEVTWGKDADAQKKAEYNRGMGQTADLLARVAAGEEVDPDLLSTCSRYISNLAEDEKRFVNRRRARSVSLAHARDVLMVRQFKEAAQVVFKNAIVPKGYAAKPPKKGRKRVVNLLLSDLHFGAALSGDELPLEYNANTEARRLAKVVAECRDYKPHYRADSTLHLYVNGDIIEGYLLHDIRDGDTLTDQFVGIVYALTQAIGVLAAAYPRVKVFWQSGNHGRNKLRHPGRATSSKWDSFETMAGVSVELACKNLANVVFDIPQTPYCDVELPGGAHLLLTHGDTTLNVGNPGKSLQLEKIDHQMARINATLKYGQVFDVFAVGHVHIGVSVSLAAGHLMVNPPLTPVNGFADSLGYVSQCGQWLWESIEGYPVGDSRLIRVGAAEDNDASLEKIIKPARFSYDC